MYSLDCSWEPYCTYKGNQALGEDDYANDRGDGRMKFSPWWQPKSIIPGTHSPSGLPIMCTNKPVVEAIWTEIFDLEVESLLFQPVAETSRRYILQLGIYMGAVGRGFSHLPMYLWVDINMSIWVNMRTYQDNWIYLLIHAFMKLYSINLMSGQGISIWVCV